jgi:two-component system sensor histidine kinase UhpB
VSLFWRVCVINAALLVAATLALALSPATVSSELLLREAVVLVIGLTSVLTLNLVLVRRTLEPVERLSRFMRDVDLLSPRRRLPVTSGTREVEELTAAFNAMLDRLELERRESGRRAVDAQEQERRRLALELHDEVGQTLAGVVLGLDGLRQAVPDELRGGVETMQDVVREGAEHVREIARGLRPVALEELGLRAALVSLLSAVADTSGLRVQRRIAGSLPALEPEVELVVYRVAQESLANVARHAQAARVEVSLEGRDSAVELRIVDDGRGIDPGALRSSRGLQGMHERAVYVGGLFGVRAVEPHGTEVHLRVPGREEHA